VVGEVLAQLLVQPGRQVARDQAVHHRPRLHGVLPPARHALTVTAERGRGKSQRALRRRDGRGAGAGGVFQATMSAGAQGSRGICIAPTMRTSSTSSPTWPQPTRSLYSV